ncbi:MAG: glycosyltransferase [Epsilonproteobacteria bacterium]|nr:glycosyltransferase [Campylobacterota bacterium]
MNQKNILHLITCLPLGGAEKVLLDLCTNLDKNTIKSHVIALNDENDYDAEFKAIGINVVNLNMTKSPKSFYDTAKQINNYIKTHHIDIVHMHMFHPLVFVPFIKLADPKIKVVFTSHNVNIGSKLREIVTYLFKPFRDTDVVFSKDMINSMYVKDTVVIPNGIDTSGFQKNVVKNEKFTFISVGVLREQKNQLFLPSCARYIKDKGFTDFEIQIVGGPDASGDMRPEIENEIKKHDVANEINMLGARRDIPNLLKKAHCFIMPSHFEGLPIALLEAGAAGLTVVSTPVGAIPTVIDENSGYLAELGQFAQAMEKVIKNRGEAEEKGKNLQQKIEEDFSIKSMAAAHETIYDNLTSN